MNEDELINIVEIAIDKLRFWENHGWISKIENKEVHEYKEAIQGLLDLYNKEKRKNESLLQCLKDSQERCENEHLFLGNPDM